MNQPTANSRPTHGGYPNPEQPLVVGGPGRDFGPDIGVICAAPGTHAEVARKLAAPPADDSFRAAFGAPPAPGSVGALGFWDIADRTGTEPSPVTLAAILPARAEAESVAGTARAAAGTVLAERVIAEFDAGATSVQIDAIDPADVDYVPHDMLVALPPLDRNDHNAVEAYLRSRGLQLAEFGYDWTKREDNTMAVANALEYAAVWPCTADRARRGTCAHPTRNSHNAPAEFVVAAHHAKHGYGIEPGFTEVP